MKGELVFTVGPGAAVAATPLPNATGTRAGLAVRAALGVREVDRLGATRGTEALPTRASGPERTPRPLTPTDRAARAEISVTRRRVPESE